MPNLPELTLPELGMSFAFLMLLIGLCGVMFRKNLIIMMLSIEVMLNAANLAFVCGGKLTGTVDGEVTMFFVMAVAACEAAIGLALLIALYRNKATVEADDLKLLRG